MDGLPLPGWDVLDKIGVVSLALLFVFALIKEWVLIGRTVRRSLAQSEAREQLTQEAAEQRVEEVKATADAQVEREQLLADERVAREREYAKDRIDRETALSAELRQAYKDEAAAHRVTIGQMGELMVALELVKDFIRGLPPAADIPSQRGDSL